MSFNKYPELKERLEMLCQIRPNEILQNLVETNAEYGTLRRKRTECSMLLRNLLGDKYIFLENYTNAVYAQESYEINMLYRQGMLDALNLISTPE